MNELLEANKRTIQEYTELAFNQRKPEEAVAKYQGTPYRQHNPGSPDGPEPFIRVVKWLAQTYPSFTLSSSASLPTATWW
jgi:predicted SnoaL-like aldol condensation-catalyzing enzyme